MMDHRHQWYRRIFGSVGERYFEFDYARGTTQEVGFLKQLFGNDLNQTILDVGCGPGRHSIELSRLGYRTYGIDLSHRFLQIAGERSSSRNMPFTWALADARNIPFYNSFDWAICLCEGAFGILDNDLQNQQVLNSIGTCLKKGGRLLLNVLNASFIFRHPENDERLDVKNCIGYWTEYYTTEAGEQKSEKCFNRYYTFPEIKLMLEKAGMEVLEGWGCIAGQFQKKEIELDDFEMLVLARKD